MNRKCSAALALLSLLTFSVTARAEVFKTSTRFDTFDGVCDEDCSLRDAVVASNAHHGLDVILLQAIPKESGLHVLTLTGPDEDLAATGDLDVAAGEELVIIGSGPKTIVIDGFGPFGTDRVFDVRGSLVLQDVIVRNGQPTGSGGGLRNTGRLTLIRCEISGSLAAGFGGGILSSGFGSELTLLHTAVVFNRAAGGGGLAASGRVVALDSLVKGNHALTDFGGGAYLFSGARALFAQNTFSGNSAALAGGALFLETPLIPHSRLFTSLTFENNSAPVDPDCAGSGCPAI